jgi:hypothetical protein
MPATGCHLDEAPASEVQQTIAADEDGADDGGGSFHGLRL